MKKQFSKSKPICKVTFSLPVEVSNHAASAVVVGEFNDWDHTGIPLKKSKDGSFKTTVDLEIGRAYEFRYLIDKVKWENDSAADAYVPSPFDGIDNSLVSTILKDDLTKIEGIGPKIAKLLIEADIDTFAILARAKVGTLKEILSAAGSRFSVHVPNSWPKQAKLAAKGDWAKLQTLQDELDGGK